MCSSGGIPSLGRDCASARRGLAQPARHCAGTIPISMIRAEDAGGRAGAGGVPDKAQSVISSSSRERGAAWCAGRLGCKQGVIFSRINPAARPTRLDWAGRRSSATVRLRRAVPYATRRCGTAPRPPRVPRHATYATPRPPAGYRSPRCTAQITLSALARSLAQGQGPAGSVRAVRALSALECQGSATRCSRCSRGTAASAHAHDTTS